MTKVTRLSSMIDGLHCTIQFNGQTKNYKVQSNERDEKFIRWNGKVLHEKDLPMGEEVDV